jgi:regulation of enolase protein 1 (concanavalin A-like superfamily)
VTVQAEDYDLGGEGVAYHDTTSGNAGSVYRPAEGVDLRATADAGGGYRTASPKAGEWLEYTVDVAAAGLYDLAFRVATSGTGGRFHVEVDGQDVTGSLAVPNTGGYDTFATVTKAGVQLAAGRHVLRVALDADATSGWAPGLNWFRVAPAAQTQENPTLPEGWTGADVGTVGKAGSSYASDGVFTVTGAGDGIGGRRDEAHLAYRTLAGNGQIVARLTGFDAASPADALAGLQIRLSTNSQQKAASLLLTKGGQLKTVLRSGFGTSATTRSVTGGGVPQWMKLIRAGDTITLHASADGTTWSQVGHLMTSLYDNVLVGLTVSSGTSTALATATFDNVSVTPA